MAVAHDQPQTVLVARVRVHLDIRVSAKARSS